MQVDFNAVFATPVGERVLDEIMHILHFTEPAQTERDIALQNAAKAIWHRLGKWGDAEKDRKRVIHTLLKGQA